MIVVGRNYATDQIGGIHDDEAANAYGYRSGLVPGVALFTAALPHVTELIGKSWAARGRVHLHFPRPCYEGGELMLKARPIERDGSVRIDLVDAENSNSCAMSFFEDSGTPPRAEDYPVEPSQTWAESAEDYLLDLENMRAISRAATAVDIAQYVSDVGGQDPFLVEDLVNPGYLLRTYVYITRLNFPEKLSGPTIHVSSIARYFNPISVGTVVSIRGKVKHIFAKRGNRYVTYDYAWFTEDGTAVLHDEHTVVYELRAHRKSRGEHSGD